MATIDRPQTAQVVAHATEYPADKDGDGTGYDRKHKRNSAQRPDAETGPGENGPAVFFDTRHPDTHALDGVAAYRAAALKALEPGIDHGPVHPMTGKMDGMPPDEIRHAYEDHGGEPAPHALNVAT